MPGYVQRRFGPLSTWTTRPEAAPEPMPPWLNSLRHTALNSALIGGQSVAVAFRCLDWLAPPTAALWDGDRYQEIGVIGRSPIRCRTLSSLKACFCARSLMRRGTALPSFEPAERVVK
jgi:hypothetical protein